MSILIKGMSMPPNDGRGRRVCFTQKDGEWVLIVEDAKSYDDRTAHVYPLVEIPEPLYCCTDIGLFDKEETYPNCTVQILTNTITGEQSVGWWRNEQ